MEASSGIPLKSSSGAGGEMRRIHIIYFLSHNLGRFEHPHLIRVHHFNLNGVYLRGNFLILSSNLQRFLIVI
jgi:hypothetical protein